MVLDQLVPLHGAYQPGIRLELHLEISIICQAFLLGAVVILLRNKLEIVWQLFGQQLLQPGVGGSPDKRPVASS